MNMRLYPPSFPKFTEHSLSFVSRTDNSVKIINNFSFMENFESPNFNNRNLSEVRVMSDLAIFLQNKVAN